MRLSTVMAVLLIGTLLYIAMALIRALAIARMQGQQDEAAAYRLKALRAAMFGALLLGVSLLTGWW